MTQATLNGIALLGIGAAVTWAPVVAFAYWRRSFGGSARNYALAFLGLSALTTGILGAMTIIEAS